MVKELQRIYRETAKDRSSIRRSSCDVKFLFPNSAAKRRSDRIAEEDETITEIGTQDSKSMKLDASKTLPI